jgi:hypothetical protein
MELPGLRHFRNEGIFHIKSDVVEALHGEAWIAAVYTDKGWATADGSTLLTGVEDWRYAIEEGQEQKDDSAKHQARNQGRQAAKASGSNRVRKSRKVSQAEG